MVKSKIKYFVYLIAGKLKEGNIMDANAMPDMKEYMDALSRHETKPQGNPNHSEDCSFEAFKSAADCLIEAVSNRKKV